MHSLLLKAEADEHHHEGHQESDNRRRIALVVVQVVDRLLVHVGNHGVGLGVNFIVT